MSNEVKLENAKPGMWVEFDVKHRERFDPGHYVLELVPPPEPEGAAELMYLDLCRKIFKVDPMNALGVVVDGDTVPIIDDKREPWHDVENLHVYDGKPDDSSDDDIQEITGYIMVAPGGKDDLSGIPTEPGLYRAATGSTWYYDGKSWTPITDHDGNWTYSQKQSYKRFIETSLASHRLPFTPISLPDTGTHDPVDMLPTEPGWYEDNDNEFYWFDGCEWHYVALEDTTVALTNSEMRKYVPMKRIDDIDSYLKDLFGGESNGQA